MDGGVEAGTGHCVEQGTDPRQREEDAPGRTLFMEERSGPLCSFDGVLTPDCDGDDVKECGRALWEPDGLDGDT